MIYKEIIGDVECVYEGTAKEIADLCNKINTKPVAECECQGSVLNIGLTKAVAAPFFPPGDRGEELITPKRQGVNITVNIDKNTDINKVAEEMASKISEVFNKCSI